MDDYRILIQDVKQYIADTYKDDARIATDPAMANYFRALYTPQKPAPKPQVAVLPQPVVAAPPPQPKPTPKPAIVKRQPQPIAPPPVVERPSTISRAPSAAQQNRNPDFTTIKQNVKQLFPDWKIVDDVPPDTKAQRMATLWSESYPEVVVVAETTDKQEIDLLTKIVAAIETLGLTARLIPLPVDWSGLLAQTHIKLLLVSSTILSTEPALKSDVTIPIVPLEEVSLYLKHAEKKAALWRNLKAQLT